MPDATTIEQRKRIPEWLRLKLPSSSAFTRTRSLLDELNLHTVCESAKCPNHWECWSKGTATFMIAGDRCTRACGFCAVNTAKPLPLEGDEPERVAEATFRMKLGHVVITAVARDDLADGGANHFRETIKAVRRRNPGIVIEVLVPDFLDKDDSLQMVLDAGPEIFNHNLETVERLQQPIRKSATYERTLSVLAHAKTRGFTTKSGIMLGIGEREDEIGQAIRDLSKAGVQILTIGQYLQPTPSHAPIDRWAPPEEFEAWKEFALSQGIGVVESGPLVRSSYHAEEQSERFGIEEAASA